MCIRYLAVITMLSSSTFLPCHAEPSEDNRPGLPTKVYVPYEELRGVFEKERQGVFLPYDEFQKLWHAAQGRPLGIAEAPFDYLITTARLKGTVEEELASLQLELTIDILKDDKWIRVPVGLGNAAVSNATFTNPPQVKTEPLLQTESGQYILTARGRGRYVLNLEFVCQLKTEPGLHVLSFGLPATAITTLELLIPEENLKVDVDPMLAATTSQIDTDGRKSTRLLAFLGSAEHVTLSWKPQTQAAAQLKPVITAEQFHHIKVAEALITHEIELNYTIRRGGVDSFSVNLPADLRLTDVDGANISRWDIETDDSGAAGKASQQLKVELFSQAKKEYILRIKMERFLQETQTQFAVRPVITEDVFRRTGLIALTCSPRRVLSLKDVKNLARVDTSRLPDRIQKQHGVTAHRFITGEYAATLVIGMAAPRVTVNQRWMLGVDSDRLELRGKAGYKVDRTGIFELRMDFPEPWHIESVGPENLVDDFMLKGSGKNRVLQILFKKERSGSFDLEFVARSDRADPEDAIDFKLPLPDHNNLQLYQGQLILLLADHLRTELKDLRQLQSISLQQADKWTQLPGLEPAMAFDFRAIDPGKPSGASFKIVVKPPQVSAVVHRLVNIQRGSVEQQAVIDYRIRYAPVDTFYVKLPAELANEGIRISGNNIKEKPRIEKLPESELSEPNQAGKGTQNWEYHKIVLQSKVKGSYRLIVDTRRAFQIARAGQFATIDVLPILAAGKLSDQTGHIAVAKADTFTIGPPVIENLIPADPTSSEDLPYESHRRIATLAFKYNAPPFALTLPVVVQEEAVIFTTIASCVVIEQVLGRDGVVNTHAMFMLATSKGDRLPIILPPGAELTAVLLNGVETPLELGSGSDQRVVRLPPSAGQVSRFVLEIAYGLKSVSASHLPAPVLPDEVPVQQTIWKLWIPDDYYLLGYDRVFSRISQHHCHTLLSGLSSKQPVGVSSRLSGQGKNINFLRQGPADRLSVWVAAEAAFSGIIWVLVLAAGLLMMKLAAFPRVLITLAAALVAGIVHLFTPLLIEQAVHVGVFAAGIVVLFWAAQWAFVKLPEIRKTWPPKHEPKPELSQRPETGEQNKNPESEKTEE